MKRVPYTIVIDTKDVAARDLLIAAFRSAHEDGQDIVSMNLVMDPSRRDAVAITGDILVVEPSDLCTKCGVERHTISGTTHCRQCDIDQAFEDAKCVHCGEAIWNEHAEQLGIAKAHAHLEICPCYCAFCKSRGCLICAARCDAAKAATSGASR